MRRIVLHLESRGRDCKRASWMTKGRTAGKSRGVDDPADHEPMLVG